MMLKMVHPIKKFVSQTTKIYYLTYFWQNEKGFSLFSVLIATSIFLTLSMLWVSYLALTVKVWYIANDNLFLCDAGRYMQGVIEKDIGYESTLIKIRKDTKGFPVLECQSLNGNKVITIFKEDVRLLKKIKTGKGTGSNALYINGCNVEDWQVERIDSKNLRISFLLKRKEKQRLFKQIVHCYNGEITNA